MSELTKKYMYIKTARKELLAFHWMFSAGQFKPKCGILKETDKENEDHWHTPSHQHKIK